MSKRQNQFVKWEPSPKWVRTKCYDEIVADSSQPLLVWEHDKYPFYYFRKLDVRMQYLVPTGKSGNGRETWHLRIGDDEVANAAYGYTELTGEEEALNDTITFRWDKMDHWYEEAEEIFVHPRDPYKRIDVLASSRHVRVALDGVTLADTRRPYLLFETGLPMRYYMRLDDVNMALLTATQSQTQCAYKGEASYWSATVNGREYKDIVWCYLDPVSDFPKIKGLLCFFNEKVDIFVDGELQERPRTQWS